MSLRKFRGSFVCFFNLTIFNLLIALSNAVIIYLSPRQYFYFYWTAAAIGTAFAFAVIYEVFLHILRPYPALLDFGKLLFRWAILFLTLASLLTAVATGGSQSNKICAAIQLLNRSAQLMQCGLLLLLVLFEKRLGVSWKNPSVAIIAGIGALAAAELASSYLRTQSGLWAVFDFINDVMWVIVPAGWCLSFYFARHERLSPQDSPTRLILQRWNEALMVTPLVGRKNQIAVSPIESFLPGVEQTVERVMARKMMH